MQKASGLRLAVAVPGIQCFRLMKNKSWLPESVKILFCERRMEQKRAYRKRDANNAPGNADFVPRVATLVDTESPQGDRGSLY